MSEVTKSRGITRTLWTVGHESIAIFLGKTFGYIYNVLYGLGLKFLTKIGSYGAFQSDFFLQ